MIGTRVDLELREELAAEDVLREHALHGLLDRELGLANEKLAVRLFAEATRLAAVTNVLLLLELAARELDLARVDDDDEVTGVDVRGEGRLVLAAEDHRNAGREA